MATSCDSSRSESVYTFSHDASCCIESLDFDGQFLDDVGLEDVENLHGTVEELGDLDGRVDDTCGLWAVGDRHDDGCVIAVSCWCSQRQAGGNELACQCRSRAWGDGTDDQLLSQTLFRSEEHTSELQSLRH